MISYTSLFDGALVTVVRLHCSSDLKSVKVFLSVFGSKNEENIFDQLENRRSQLQYEISKKIRMKFCPKISFIRDRSIDKLIHVSSVLNKNQEQKNQEQKKD